MDDLNMLLIEKTPTTKERMCCSNGTYPLLKVNDQFLSENHISAVISAEFELKILREYF